VDDIKKDPIGTRFDAWNVVWNVSIVEVLKHFGLKDSYLRKRDVVAYLRDADLAYF
jgi:hypothetical protein